MRITYPISVLNADLLFLYAAMSTTKESVGQLNPRDVQRASSESVSPSSSSVCAHAASFGGQS